MADLQRRIKHNWHPPRGNESKRVVVLFSIHKDGRISHLRVERSSGVEIADQAALTAVQKASPVRQLPEGASQNVDIQFTFDYNVFHPSNETSNLEPSPTGNDAFGVSSKP
jgi:TonB family protein